MLPGNRWTALTADVFSAAYSENPGEAADSASGEIVGYYVDSANQSHGFLPNDGGFTPIDLPGADVVFTRAWGINLEGNIVGAYMNKDCSGVLNTTVSSPRNNDKTELRRTACYRSARTL